MRKLSKSNKISFNIFGVIIILIIVLLSYVSIQVLASEKQEYALKKASTVYDRDMSAIDVVSDGTITKEWNGNYYALLPDVGDYNLGTHGIIYNNSDGSIMILGSGYQVFTDGTVSPIDEKTDITDLNEIKLYKLADRKYLLIGSQIVSQDEVISTSQYLEITMDKSGNALLTNDEINYKTMNPVVLESDQVKFDIANEKFTYQEQVVDLKKINGSSNEYKPSVDEKDSVDDETTTPPSSVVPGGSGGSGGTGGSGGNGNSSGGGLYDDNTGNGGNIGGTTGGTTPKPTPPKNLERSISIRGTSSTVNSITVNYQIVDVENKFVSTYIVLEDLSNQTTTRYGVNKADSSMTLRGLAPNNQYKIYLHYDMYMLDKDKVNTLTENTAGVVKVRTKNIQSTVNITRISSQKLYFTVTTDSKYVLDSASVTLYVDGIKKESQAVKVSDSIRDGWSGYFNIEEGSVYKLSLENAIYNGDSIKLNSQCTTKVSTNTESFIQSILNWFK